MIQDWPLLPISTGTGPRVHFDLKSYAFGACGKMTIAPQRAAAQPVPNKSTEAIDPVYRQIRDLVYKTSGIYKAEEKLYLLADGCGRRMKQLATRTPREYWDRLNAAP